MFKRCFALVLVFISTLNLGANLNYADGSYLQTRYSYLKFISNSIRVDTPIDHNQPHLGQFSLYSHFLRPYDPKRPTLIYLPPLFGHSIHTISPSLIQYLQNLNFNILLIEPRGVGFSKPSSERTQNSPLFFTLESMAHDIESVRKHLKLTNISILSSGFSSSIAQIYAHYYPQSVKNIVMENPVFLEKNSLVTNPKLIDETNAYLRSLKPDLLEKIKSLNLLDSSGQSHWLLAIVKSILTNYHPEKLKVLTRLLEDYAHLDGSFYVFRIQFNLARELATETMSHTDHMDALIDASVHNYLTYQYFNAYQPQSKLRWHFSPKGNLQLSPLRHSDLVGPLFKNKDINSTEPFNPSNYPIQMPVQVFYGGLDLFANSQQLANFNDNKGYIIEIPTFGRNPLLQINQSEKNIPYTFTFENQTVPKVHHWLVTPVVNIKKIKFGEQKKWADKFPDTTINILNNPYLKNPNSSCSSILEEE